MTLTVFVDHVAYRLIRDALDLPMQGRGQERIVATGLQRVVPGQLVSLAQPPITLAENRHD